MAKLQTLSK